MACLRVTTAGESHGPAEVCLIEGIPAGLALTSDDVTEELARRRQGYGRGGRMAIESDRARFLAGVRRGRTLGSPIAILVENSDHHNWLDRMSPDSPERDSADDAPQRVTVPRPGHADLAGVGKYGHDDVRNVLERASARETVGRVAAGAVCKRLLAELGVTVRGRVLQVGSVRAAAHGGIDPHDIDWQAVEASPVACEDARASREMCAAIDDAKLAGESLGGIFEVWCWGLCPGLGSYASYGERLDGRLLGAIGSIPAVKGVEIGDAFSDCARPGSAVHDALYIHEEAGERWVTRRTNRAGGLEGGMTNGMPVLLRAAMKPIPTLTDPLPSVELDALEPTKAHVERSDITAVPAARIVGEAMVAIIIAQAYREKFGGDGLEHMKRAVSSFEHELQARGLWRRS